MDNSSFRHWLNRHTDGRPLLFALWLVLLFAILHNFLIHSAFSPGIRNYTGNDYMAFYDASRDLWAGRPVFPDTVDVDVFAEYEEGPRRRFWGGYVYPTIHATFLGIVSWLPPLASKKVYVFASALIYAAVFWDLLRLFLPRRDPWLILGAMGVWFLWGPTIETLRLGQANTPVFLLLYLAWRSARSGRRTFAGLCVGFAATVKLTPLVILPFFLLRREWKTFLAGCLGFLIPLAVCFPSENIRYFQYLLPGSTRLMGILDPPSVYFFTLYLFSQAGFDPARGGLSLPRTVSAAAAAVLYGWTLLFAWWRRKDWALDDVLLFAISITPLITAREGHHYIISIIPIMVALLHSDCALAISDRKWPGWAFVFGLLLLIPAFYQIRILGRIWDIAFRLAGLPRCNLLFLSQTAWFLILWPRIYRPHERVKENEDRPAREKVPSEAPAGP